MSRSGYSDDWDGDGMSPDLYRNAVNRAIAGKRGQSFLQALAEEMDAMPDKILIAEELVDATGNCCTMGVLCKARGIDVSNVDEYDRDQVGGLLNIAPAMAAEIAYENDDGIVRGRETPEQRWVRMRKWVSDNLRATEPKP